MDAKRRARYEARAKVLKALAHPTRLFFVEELARGERCVYELQAMVGGDISTVSKHLAQLRNAGIVGNDKRGSQVFYSLRTACVPRFLDCIQRMVKESARRQMACAG